MTTRARFNPRLLDIAFKTISGIEKYSFVPAPPQAPGQMPGGTPMTNPGAMQGQGQPPQGGPPPGMDPSQMGAGPGGPPPGIPPMDPSQMGGGPGQGPMMPPPGPGGPPVGPDGLPMAGMDPSQGGPDASAGSDDIKAKIKEVLEETGVVKPPKLKPDDHYAHIISSLQTIADALGVKLPKPSIPGSDKDGSGAGASGSGGSGSGPAPSPIGGTSTEALGNAGINPVAPPDPGMFAPPVPPTQKAASTSTGANTSLKAAMARLRHI